MQALTEFYTSSEAAARLKVTTSTLRNSRHTGRLAGVEAPRYRKVGNRAFYAREALDQWLEQFEERTRASEEAAA